MRKVLLISIAMMLLLLSGCAKAPMATLQESNEAKLFNPPSEGKSGIYIYRDSILGAALTKAIYIDDEIIGYSAPKVFFYEEVDGNSSHKFSTQSEFSNNDIVLQTEAGKHYFLRQYIKMGVFVGGANLEVIDEDEAKRAILGLKMAKSYRIKK